MNKWQPFDTAPMDGTEILGYHDSVFLLLSYDQLYKRWWSDGRGDLGPDTDYEYGLPTHWMSLTVPPEEDDEGRAMTEWQPFDTAPMDGTEILGYRGNGPEEDESAWLLMAYTDIYDTWWVDGLGYLQDGQELPTHWMPLPEPPANDEVEP